MSNRFYRYHWWPVELIVATAILALTVFGCSSDSVNPAGEQEYLATWAQVDSVSVASVDSLTVGLQVYGKLPNPCTDLDVELSIDLASMSVEVLTSGLLLKSAVCPGVIYEFRLPVDVTVPAMGLWEIRFVGAFESEAVVEVRVP